MPTLNEVFVPNDQPTFTYVKRDTRKLEDQLRDFSAAKNIVVSISGPSKTGKTVLIRSVIESDLLITISGASIKSIDDFWGAIFSWIETPNTIVKIQGKDNTISLKGDGGAQANLPFIGKADINVGLEAIRSTGSSVSKTFVANPFLQVVKEIGNSDFIIFIDDFHYIPKEIQVEIAKIIKALAESNVRICTASVPHRSEDVVRANPELRGRLAAIDIPEWEATELRAIAERGFAALNLDISPRITARLAGEALGSPQLMQVLCMNLCRELGIREMKIDKVRYEVSNDQVSVSLEATSNFANSASLVNVLHSGPKIKGQPRMQYNFIDESKGDVYRAILLAIKKDPISTTFTYDEIYNRVKDVCIGDSPTGQSISQSLTHMMNLAISHDGDKTLFEWDDATLHITDPYFTFYIRCSAKISALGKIRA